jgi:hypothetical protein
MLKLLTEEQQTEIMRLASMLATARVRRYAVKYNPSSHNGETELNVEIRNLKAEDKLRQYLKGL